MENAQDVVDDSSIGTMNSSISDDECGTGNKQSEADAGVVRKKTVARSSASNNAKGKTHSSDEEFRARQRLNHEREINRQSKIRCRKRKKEDAACLRVQETRLREEYNSLYAENRELRQEWEQCCAVLERPTTTAGATNDRFLPASFQTLNIPSNAQQQFVAAGPVAAFAQRQQQQQQQPLLSHLNSPRSSSYLDFMSAATVRRSQQQDDNHHLASGRFQSFHGADFDDALRSTSMPATGDPYTNYGVPLTIPPSGAHMLSSHALVAHCLGIDFSSLPNNTTQIHKADGYEEIPRK